MKWKICTICFFALQFCLSLPISGVSENIIDATWVNIDGVSVPVPPSEHPRLYVRRHDLDDLQKRISHPILSPIWERLVERSKSNTQTAVEVDALRYLLNQDKTLGRNTIISTLELLKQSTWKERQDVSRVIGRMLVTGAIVYDWCYDLITDEEKEAFTEQFLRIAKLLECGYPPDRLSVITSHASEAMIMRDLISAGIAVFDEFPEMYQLAARRFFGEFVPARNWFYPGHDYHQGDSYGPYRYSWDIVPLWIFDRMGAGNVYHSSQQFVPYSWIYRRRPDGQLMRSGDCFFYRTRRGEPWPFPFLALIASYYGDEYVFNEAARSLSGGDIFDLLWRDPELKAQIPDDLPLSRYFGFPFGAMIARTGWGENSVIAEMKVNCYHFANHEHLDAGQFQIYYKGALALDSGLYEGAMGGYGSDHDINYLKRTIAHNTLLVYDPDEEFYWWSTRVDNDGGQRMPNNCREPQNLDVLLDVSNNYKTGEVLAYGFGPDSRQPEYTYLKGDITAAYSEKVKDVRRSFVFLNFNRPDIPAALVVFDKVVTSNPEFKKYWLLHSEEKPVVDGNEVVITRTEYGESGKLINTVLLPELGNSAIVPVGGEDNEFMVFGINYPNDLRSGRDQVDERGAWRIELSPTKASSEDYFLNIMQITDRSVSRKLTVKSITSEDVTGVLIADRIVLFNRTSEKSNDTVTFTVEGNGTFKNLVTDLAEGTWQIWKDGNIYIPAISVTDDEGALYFSGSSGQYTLRR